MKENKRNLMLRIKELAYRYLTISFEFFISLNDDSPLSFNLLRKAKGRRKEGERKAKGRRKEGERKAKGRRNEDERKAKGRRKEGERKAKKLKNGKRKITKEWKKYEGKNILRKKYIYIYKRYFSQIRNIKKITYS
jgi:hypothetical protein